MPDKSYLILAVNPGSTSTKVAVYRDTTMLVSTTIRYDPDDFKHCDGILDQKDLRKKDILSVLEQSDIKAEKLDAVVGRGGFIHPIESGTYLINEKMIEDLKSERAAVHASSLGGLIAGELSERYNIPGYVVDPIVVDEMESCAKLTGIPGIRRSSVFHALNTKAIARKCAQDLGVKYEDSRFIVAHMGGGITVGAHRYGRVIDVSNALTGEGPFTPERCGAIPAEPLIELCFSGKYQKQELLSFLNQNGGFQAHLGTNSMLKVEQMIKDGEQNAALVLDAMTYQISKEIGSMAAVLEGRIDAIILTGGLAHSTRFTGAIKERIDEFAPVYTYPGEDELAALTEGALRVLKGEEIPKSYL